MSHRPARLHRLAESIPWYELIPGLPKSLKILTLNENSIPLLRRYVHMSVAKEKPLDVLVYCNYGKEAIISERKFSCLKGTVSRDFLLQVLFMNQFPPSPRVFH